MKGCQKNEKVLPSAERVQKKAMAIR